MKYRIRLLSAPLLIAVYVLLMGLLNSSVAAVDAPDSDSPHFGSPVELRAAGQSSTAPAPTGLAVAVESNGRDLDVTFTPHTVTGKPHFYEFELYRSASSSGSYSLVDTIGADASPADFDYQPRGNWYKARGRNCTTVAKTTCGNWTSLTSAFKFSDPISFTPAPKGLRSTRSTEDRVYLSWNSVSDASRYMVEYSSSRSGPWLTGFSELSRTYYIVHGLKCGTYYFFRVRARGDGSPYSTKYGSPSVGPIPEKTGDCTNPTNLANPPSSITQLTPRSKTTIKLDWPSVPNAAAYLTERSDSEDGPWSVVRFPATISARNDDVGLECGQTYYYRVRTRGDGSPLSSVFGKASTTKEAYTAPCVPDNEPAVELFSIADSIEVGSSDAFYVKATNLLRSNSYTVRLTTTEDAAFDSGCTLRQKDSTISRGHTSDSIFLKLYSCDTTEARVEAVLLSGGDTVYTAAPGIVKVTATDMLKVSNDSPFLGQAVTLTASSPSPYGTVSSYQFQKQSGSGWSDLGTSNSTGKKTDRAYDEATQAYRVLFSYTSGDMKASPALSVNWKPITVYLDTSSEIPVSNDSKKREITLTAITDAPSPFNYQFYQDTGSGYTAIGRATSSNTKTASFSTSGTRKFYVQVIPSTKSGLSRSISNTVYVTWDGGTTLAALVGALDSAIIRDATFQKARKDLLDCMNGVQDGARGIAGQNATSTPPLPPGGGVSGQATTFSSFGFLLGSYTGETRDKMEDDDECGVQADRVFNRVAEIAPAKLTTLKNNDATYADFLSTPIGQSMEGSLGSAAAAKNTAGLLAYPSSTISGASGSSSTTSGWGCVPSTEPNTLDEKLKVLDCLIFKTPHSFWLNKDGNEKEFKLHSWLGVGDWKCTFPGYQGPVSSCLKHDVSFGSLQKFAGINPNNIPGGLENGAELDEAWNPRNKSLADSKLYADIMRYGCELEGIAERYTVCKKPRELIANYFFTGVAFLGHRGWPVTEEDVAHIGGYKHTLDAESTEYSYFACHGLLPTTSNVNVTHTHGRGFSINWTNSLDSCIPGITIKDSQTCIRVYYSGRNFKGCKSKTSGTPTSAFISLGYALNRQYIDYIEVESRLYPHRHKYGKNYYSTLHYVVPKRN